MMASEVAAPTWLAPATADAVADLAHWYTRRPRSVRTIPDFLPEATAVELREALSAHRHWSASRHVAIPGNTTREVSTEEWDAAASDHRFSAHFVLRPIGALIPSEEEMAPPLRLALMRFARAAIVGPELRDWASAITEFRLDGRVGCEITRYAQGDFIAPHTDHYDGRSLALVLYFDDGDEASGGVLHFRNEQGIETAHPPRFNQAALIPIDAQCRHWVSPWRRPAPGRETISLAFRAG